MKKGPYKDRLFHGRKLENVTDEISVMWRVVFTILTCSVNRLSSMRVARRSGTDWI